MTTRSTPRGLYFLSALALAGTGVSVALTQHYYEVRNGTAGFQSFCKLGATMNCDAVAASPYADLVGGFPLSSFAAGWFLALFIVSLIACNVYSRREALRALLGMTALSVVFSLGYLWVMASVLHTYCLLCLVTDAINLAAFTTVLSLKPEGLSKHKLEFSKWKSLLGVTAASVLVMVIGLKSLDAAVAPPASTDEVVTSDLTTPVLPIGSGPEFPFIGPASAPVTIVEFSDFQCPYCRIGAFTLNTVLEQNPGKVRVVFRNFPLDAACNRKMDRSMHPYACDAAKHAICAHKQGKFQAVYENLFQNQATFAPGRVAALAQEAGADPKPMAACVASNDTSVALARDVEEAITLNIQSTPTFFINGHKLEGVRTPAVWRRLIDELIQAKK